MYVIIKSLEELSIFLSGAIKKVLKKNEKYNSLSKIRSIYIYNIYYDLIYDKLKDLKPIMVADVLNAIQTVMCDIDSFIDTIE